METEKQDKIAIVYPKRPNRDSNRDKAYRKSRVICNLRQLNLGEESKQVQQYAIHYEPIIAEDNYPLKRKIIKQLSEDLKGYFERYAQAGDTIFVFSKNSQEKVSLETKIDEVLYKVTFDRTSNKVNCRNINKKTIDNIKIKSFIENIIKNIFMANNYMVRFDNGSFFDYNSSSKIGNNSKMWSGYSTAVTITESGLYLRINDKNKLITGKTVFDKFEEFRSKYGNMRSEECMRNITDYFKGKVVIAGYGNFRAYRIGDISFDRDIKNTEFEIEKEGKKEKINEEVPRRRKEEEKIIVRYLIPELCYLTGIDELDERERAEIITKSKFQPNQKVEKIEKGFSYLKNKTKKKVKKKDKEVELRSPNEIRMEWGINIGDNFVEVEAQCLPIPELEFDGKKEVPQMRNGRFRQQKDIHPVNFNDTNCMLITFENLVSLAKNDCDQMKTAGRNLGVNFDRPKLEKIYNRREEDLLNDLRKINYNDGKKVAIVVLDRSTKNLYPTIKNFLYTQGGITSQFMLHDENPKGGRKKQNLSYYSAVLNQMVVKVKGELFRINFTTKFSGNPSMIIGIDTTMGFLPKSVIIYRQGGNERQTEKIMKFELPKIIKSFEEYKENYKPKLSIFGVNKKTDLKFFERAGREGYRNIPTGTVIDKDVISPDLFEFYLQCPEVDRGTGSPVHFLCLYNNNEDLTINDFEEITYRQSYYYWNWSGPIRIPAALKYAEVANNFCGKNIRGTVRENLRDSPYFI